MSESNRLRTLCVCLLLVSASVQAADPTRPPAALRAPVANAEAPAAAPLKLQAVFRGAVAQAVIDGQVVAVGERVGDARVLAIQPGHVLIERQGQRETLRLATPILIPSRTLR